MNPLLTPYLRLLPFLPAAREHRRIHDRLYKLFDDLLDQLEVCIAVCCIFKPYLSCVWTAVYFPNQPLLRVETLQCIIEEDGLRSLVASAFMLLHKSRKQQQVHAMVCFLMEESTHA